MFTKLIMNIFTHISVQQIYSCNQLQFLKFIFYSSSAVSIWPRPKTGKPKLQRKK